MDSGLRQRPADVTLNALSEQVFDVLSRFTVFPWPVMVAQCKRVSVDPENLTKAGLAKSLPFLVTGVGRFTDEDKAASAEQALTRLLEP